MAALASLLAAVPCHFGTGTPTDHPQPPSMKQRLSVLKFFKRHMIPARAVAVTRVNEEPSSFPRSRSLIRPSTSIFETSIRQIISAGLSERGRTARSHRLEFVVTHLEGHRSSAGYFPPRLVSRGDPPPFAPLPCPLPPAPLAAGARARRSRNLCGKRTIVGIKSRVVSRAVAFDGKKRSKTASTTRSTPRSLDESTRSRRDGLDLDLDLDG